jgi:hypothetical protein
MTQSRASYSTTLKLNQRFEALIILLKLLNKLTTTISIISYSLIVNYSILKSKINVHTYIKVYTHTPGSKNLLFSGPWNQEFPIFLTCPKNRVVLFCSVFFIFIYFIFIFIILLRHMHPIKPKGLSLVLGFQFFKY